MYLEYRGFVGFFEKESSIFFGRITHVIKNDEFIPFRGIVTFTAYREKDLEIEFIESVNEYLEFISELN